jgi:phosphatidate cytidylyltransferase
VVGAVYCGIGAAVLMGLRDHGPMAVLLVLLAVIATDVGAYFSGRTFGGPKIAPSISPSKTWAGLLGGMGGAAMIFLGLLIVRWNVSVSFDDYPQWWWAMLALAAGILVAVVAQAGDFFESWLKRRAGVKDSGRLIPGHGGLFDRLDGLLAVLFLLGAANLVITGI